MRHRRHVVRGSIGLTTIAALVGLWIQVDSHLMERERIRAQMAYEAAVQDCEASGGKWFRGSCDWQEEP